MVRRDVFQIGQVVQRSLITITLPFVRIKIVNEGWGRVIYALIPVSYDCVSVQHFLSVMRLHSTPSIDRGRHALRKSMSRSNHWESQTNSTVQGWRSTTGRDRHRTRPAAQRATSRAERSNRIESNRRCREENSTVGHRERPPAEVRTRKGTRSHVDAHTVPIHRPLIVCVAIPLFVLCRLVPFPFPFPSLFVSVGEWLSEFDGRPNKRKKTRKETREKRDTTKDRRGDAKYKNNHFMEWVVLLLDSLMILFRLFVFEWIYKWFITPWQDLALKNATVTCEYYHYLHIPLTFLAFHFLIHAFERRISELSFAGRHWASWTVSATTPLSHAFSCI